MTPSKSSTVSLQAVSSFFWNEVRAATFAVAEANRVAQQKAAKAAPAPRRAPAPVAHPASRPVAAHATTPAPRPKR